MKTGFREQSETELEERRKEMFGQNLCEKMLTTRGERRDEKEINVSL